MKKVYEAKRFEIAARLDDIPVLIVIRAFVDGSKVIAIRSAVVRSRKAGDSLPRVTIGKGTLAELMASKW